MEKTCTTKFLNKIVTDKGISHKIPFSQLKSNVTVGLDYLKNLLDIKIPTIILPEKRPPQRTNPNIKNVSNETYKIKISYFKIWVDIDNFLFDKKYRPDIVVNTLIAIFKSSSDVKRLFPYWSSFCNLIFDSRVINAIKNEGRCLDLISENMNYIFSLESKGKIIAEFKRKGLWNKIAIRLKKAELAQKTVKKKSNCPLM